MNEDNTENVQSNEEAQEKGPLPTPAALEENFQIREDIQAVADRLKKYIDLLETSLPVEDTRQDRGEMIACAMLSYRHLEDAKMRLGKVAQAYNGGISNNAR